MCYPVVTAMMSSPSSVFYNSIVVYTMYQPPIAVMYGGDNFHAHDYSLEEDMCYPKIDYMVPGTWYIISRWPYSNIVILELLRPGAGIPDNFDFLFQKKFNDHNWLCIIGYNEIL